ncbi:MAG: DMT family transporter [Clostridia bacterium]|nr:DMT family transporter [Clostridia bacterium]
MNKTETSAQPKKNKLKGNIELLVCAMIWGSAFIAQKIALGFVGSFTINCIRMALASLALFPVVLFRRHRAIKKGETYPLKQSVVAGLLCGVALFAAANAQQAAIKLSTPGKVSFITAFYVVLVPIIGLIFGRKARFNVWIGAALAIVGLYLLCVVDSTTISIGDFLALASAFLFAIQITLIGHYGRGTDPLALSMVQFAVVSVLSAPPMFIFEDPSLSTIHTALIPILYAGLVSCGVG